MSAAVPLLASAVQSTSGNKIIGSDATGNVEPVGRKLHLVNAMVVQLAVTAAVAPTSLKVFLQHSLDGGTTWDDFISFTTVASSPNRQNAQWHRDILSSSPVHATADGTLASGTVINGPTGDDWRLRWDIVGTSFTFSVVARQIQRVR